MNILQEAASEFSPPPPTLQRDWRQLKGIESLNFSINADKQNNHPPVMKSNTVTRFKIIPRLRNGTVYRITGGFLYAATSSLKRVTGRFSQLASVFIEACLNLFF
jgi:hypothetical protein